MITENDIRFVGLLDQVSNTRCASDQQSFDFYEMVRTNELSEVCQVIFVSRYIPQVVALVNPCAAALKIFNEYISRNFELWLLGLTSQETSYDHYNLVGDIADTFSNDAFKLLTDETKSRIADIIRKNFQQNAYDIGQAVRLNDTMNSGREITTKELTKNILSLLTDEEAVKFVLFGSTP